NQIAGGECIVRAQCERARERRLRILETTERALLVAEVVPGPRLTRIEAQRLLEGGESALRVAGFSEQYPEIAQRLRKPGLELECESEACDRARLVASGLLELGVSVVRNRIVRGANHGVARVGERCREIPAFLEACRQHQVCRAALRRRPGASDHRLRFMARAIDVTRGEPLPRPLRAKRAALNHRAPRGSAARVPASTRVRGFACAQPSR